MKILLLGNIQSSHLQKWIKGLSENNVEVHVFSFNKSFSGDFNDKVKVHYPPYGLNLINLQKDESYTKLLFLLYLPVIRKLYKKINPDIIHAHYATSYGLLGAFLNLHPFFVSYWGSDIFSFPKKRKINRLLTNFILNRADVILSSSKTMAAELSDYTNKKIEVIHFGVDTEIFRKEENHISSGAIVIGSVKLLDETYGTDILIRLFKQLKEMNPSAELKLLLVGSGSREKEYKKMVSDLNIGESVDFMGSVPYSSVVKYHNMIDIFANLSRHESFGVSVLEASSCETPVVVSDRGGLTEVIKDGITGFSVPLEDEKYILEKFQKLIDNPILRKEMGENGRLFVIDKYNWNESVRNMISLYETTKNDKQKVK